MQSALKICTFVLAESMGQGRDGCHPLCDSTWWLLWLDGLVGTGWGNSSFAQMGVKKHSTHLVGAPFLALDGHSLP